MSILRELVKIYKANPFHDELGRFSTGGNSVTTSRGEKFKSARSNYAKVRREAKNAPDRVRRLREYRAPIEEPKRDPTQLEKEAQALRRMSNRSSTSDPTTPAAKRRQKLYNLTGRDSFGIDDYSGANVMSQLKSMARNSRKTGKVNEDLVRHNKAVERGSSLVSGLKPVYLGKNKAQKSELAMQVIRKYQGY